MTGRRSEPPDTGCRRSTGTAVTWVSQSDAQNQEHAVTKRLTLSVTVALVAILVGTVIPRECFSQAKRVVQDRMHGVGHGQTVEVPYISQRTFRSATVQGPGGSAPLHTLVSAVSIEEITRRLGEPTSIKRYSGPDGESFGADLRYEGDAILRYLPSKDGETVVLQHIRLCTPD